MVNASQVDGCKAKPFLRWAGGKSWLIKYTDQLIEAGKIAGYHEPFLGGGAVFFSLPKIKRTHLSDINPRLVETYKQVRDNVEDVIDLLKKHKNNKDYYNAIRHKKFDCEKKRAAQFIYLNQTSFNGIYRENLDGLYNVPYGHRAKDFVQEDLLRAASNKLQGTYVRAHEFDSKHHFIKEGDLIFLDPPYTITHNNNGFIKYNKKLFSLDDQHRLAGFIEKIIRKDAYYILTNAAHSEIKKIFKANQPIKVSRVSRVGGAYAPRGKYSEFIFTNLKNVLS